MARMLLLARQEEGKRSSGKSERNWAAEEWEGGLGLRGGWDIHVVGEPKPFITVKPRLCDIPLRTGHHNHCLKHCCASFE